MDLYPPLPDFQLQFGQLCTLPFVKPSQFGLLGLEHQDILLTDSTYCGKVVHRARIVDLMRVDVERSHFSSDFTRLSFVTHFDASRCMILHSGHLEQLAMACPNLYHLNLQGNHLCLERLQGLQAILACKNLQGLNLSDISRVEVECCVQLWKIFVDMRLTYLAIELCALIPWEDDSQTKEGIIGSYQKCLSLKALEVRRSLYCSKCAIHYPQRNYYNLSVLSNFPSLVHCIVDKIYCNSDAVISSCAGIKYFMDSSHLTYFPLQVSSSSSMQHHNLD